MCNINNNNLTDSDAVRLQVQYEKVITKVKVNCTAVMPGAHHVLNLI